MGHSEPFWPPKFTVTHSAVETHNSERLAGLDHDFHISEMLDSRVVYIQHHHEKTLMFTEQKQGGNEILEILCDLFLGCCLNKCHCESPAKPVFGQDEFCKFTLIALKQARGVSVSQLRLGDAPHDVTIKHPTMFQTNFGVWF